MSKKNKKKFNKNTQQALPEKEKESKDARPKDTFSPSDFEEMKSQFTAAEEYQKKHRDDPYCSWKEKEALLLGRNLDSVSNQTKSQIFDPRLSTIIIERMNRVMAQHATGKVRALDNPKDKLPSLVLDLALQRYIIPNADSQYDLLTKFKLQDFYSLAYGTYVSLVDYRVDKDYIGPDSWLIPLRHYYPEANSVNELNHAFVDTWVSRSWFKSRSTSVWKNIDAILATLDEKGSDKDTEQQTLAEQESRIAWGGKGKGQLIHLRTRYEKERWVTYAVDAAATLNERSVCRDIKNPQGNNEIPIVAKHAFPLMDRYYGLGEFERGKTLQYATNSLWNLYLDGLKMRIFPPRIINENGVVKSSLGYVPGNSWVETLPNSIRPWQTSGQSESAFQSTYSALIAAVMNQAGTTNIVSADVIDPGLGKTPEALRQMGARESSRDAWDRYLMERTVEKTFNLMIDMLVKKQEKPIQFDLFEGEIKRIKDMFPEQTGQIAEIFESQTYGRMKAEKDTFGGGKFKYRFDIDVGTTGKKDQNEEHLSITEILGLLIKVPGALEEAKQSGKVTFGSTVIDFGELMKRHIITSGLQDWDKIVSVAEVAQAQIEGEEQAGAAEPLDEKSQMMLNQLSQVFPADQVNTAGMQMGGMQ